MDDPQGTPAQSTDSITQREVTHAEVQQFAEAIGLEAAAPGRVSWIFRFQIYCLFLVPRLPGDPIKITAEVRALEGCDGPVGTRPAEQFQRSPLQGFWKKHYLVGGLASMGKNIALGFGKKKRRLHQIIRENHNPSTAHLPREAIARNLANAVTNLYAERASRQGLTGDWIIYAKHQGQNFYLCLAQHDEGDDVIFQRIAQGCFDEFPFLHTMIAPTENKK